ncbi:MAG: hypothetical protein SPF19_07280 [Oliverpabstia sp.]|nr:hypothetical protein [Lachnospiraceae bacterium]MDY5026313.1 hypothetical protein [Oliverpabstia sp.]
MKFLDKMERKFGKYALSNLSMYIIITYAAGYLIELFAPVMQQYLTLEPALILKGQIWRLVSWLLIPPESSNIFFVVIMLYFYYSIGNTLERTWGTFRYNVYIFSGIITSIIGSFILYFIAGGNGIRLGNAFSTYYISMSIILAFAATYPNIQVLFMMIIPLKIKWLGIAYAAMLAVEMILSSWPIRVVIICSLMNFIIFFFSTRNMRRYNPKEIHRRQAYKQAVHKSQVNNITKHKCAICGRTEKDGDHLEFRFCSKCNGNYEYCQDHLFTHTHVK